jgi:hypothetical protein
MLQLTKNTLTFHLVLTLIETNPHQKFVPSHLKILNYQNHNTYGKRIFQRTNSS